MKPKDERKALKKLLNGDKAGFFKEVQYMPPIISLYHKEGKVYKDHRDKELTKEELMKIKKKAGVIIWLKPPPFN